MGVPIQTRYYMTNLSKSLGTGVTFGDLQTTSPTGATTNFGWRMGIFATASMCAQKQWATEVANTAAAGWTTGPTASVPIPARGDGWIMGPFRGFFEAGTWQITHSLRSVGNGGNQLGRLIYKVYTAGDPAIPATYTSQTANWISTSLTPSLATTAIQNRITGSVTLPRIRLNNQYLIFQELFQLTVAGGNTNADADWSYGTTGGQVTASILPTEFSQATPPFVPWIQDEFPKT
jgi:hypothetical protein